MRLDRALRWVDAHPSQLLCIIGPTASGKTQLASALCTRIHGEIISADSVQVYRGFDVGSGKPSLAERVETPHHLVDILDPSDTIDAAAFAARAEAAIAEVRSRGRVPIVCGGTYFWVRALVFGLAPAPPADPQVRANHRALVERLGPEALHAELERVDPASAKRLHPNDVLRVSRALEVLELSGQTMSSRHAEHGFRDTRTSACMLGIYNSSEDLTARIAARVDGWLAAGWIDEVGGLIANGHGASRPMNSVGYKQVYDCVTGALARADLRDAIVRATRVFARKQRTWLKSAPVEWLD